MSENYESLYKELLRKYKKLEKENQRLTKQVVTLETKLNRKPIMQKRLIIKGDKLIQTKYSEISSIQAINGGISIKLNDMTTTFLWSSLKKYEEQLPSSYFKRISKSCIINTDNIERRIDQKIIMQNGDKFTISESYKNAL